MASWRTAVCPSDPILVVNTLTHQPIESHFVLSKAQHACEVLNRHEKRHCREAVYEVHEKHLVLRHK